ncbi:hypothetical protein AURDEDRAFT_124401 [Auricularia subglabra TFB-10046 SS5]|nr:hypothetical protein AURDEDRAFT_124401 [Auricularia subglabra TFB-10046 SS5]
MTATEQAALATIRDILSRLDDADKDVASSAVMPAHENAYATLKRIADGGAIPTNLLNALAPIVRSWVDHSLFVRTVHDVAANVDAATRAVHAAFANPATVAEPAVVALHKQLHQLFLFCVTAATASPPPIAAQLHGLSAVLHFVAGVHRLGLAPPPTQPQPPVPDIGSAIFRCAHPACGKLFARLFHLQFHAKLHDPAAKRLACSQCKDTFVRGADLNRHLDGHSFRCAGCNGVFSSREVIEDHQTDDDAGECKDADVEERAPPKVDPAAEPEEGEISYDAFNRAIYTVLPLQPVLQAYAAAVVAAGNMASPASVAAPSPSPVPAHARAIRTGPLPHALPAVLGPVPPPVHSSPPAAAPTPTPAPVTPAPAAAPTPTPAPESAPTPTPVPAPPTPAPAPAEPAAAAPAPADLIAQTLAAAMAQAEAELMEDYDGEYAEGDGEEYYDDAMDAEGEAEEPAEVS